MNFKGTIIEESLVNKDVIRDVKIISTKIEQVAAGHATPWLDKWTLDLVEIDELKVDEIATKISDSLDPDHDASWYADFKNDRWHYIVFLHKIFKVDRSNASEYDEVEKYGLALGIPERQLDFSEYITD